MMSGISKFRKTFSSGIKKFQENVVDRARPNQYQMTFENNVVYTLRYTSPYATDWRIVRGALVDSPRPERGAVEYDQAQNKQCSGR